MDDFGKRLRELIQGSRFKSVQQFADAAGFNRSTVHTWMTGRKGEARKPKRASIEKLAELLGCNPDWLDTGKGDAWAVQRKASGANVPSAQRLDWLRGQARLEDFAKKCGVNPILMAQYLSGARMSEDDAYRIAAVCGCSLGWLTCGEPWQGPDRPYTGFSLERHKETGERLYTIARYIRKLQLALQFSYPLTGKLGNPAKFATECEKNLQELRNALENNHLDDNGEQYDPKTYGGARAEEIEPVSNAFDEFFNAVKSWRIESGDDTVLAASNFFGQLAVPPFECWRRLRSGR